MCANIASMKSLSRASALLASPRRDGHTAYYLDEYLGSQTGYAVSLHHISGMDIKACKGCGFCNTHDSCVLSDDFEPLLKELDNAKLIIIATPVYFLGFPSGFKAFADRLQVRYAKRFIRGEAFESVRKSGVLLATAGSSQSNVFDCVEKSAKLVFDCLNADFSDKLLYSGTDKK